ncbi:MAG: hypothetical protein KDB22_02355 [Planctomycetales bacterium]|nr:hypothetical protein [Planctomycetales bacterium]
MVLSNLTSCRAAEEPHAVDACCITWKALARQFLAFQTKSALWRWRKGERQAAGLPTNAQVSDTRPTVANVKAANRAEKLLRGCLAVQFLSLEPWRAISLSSLNPSKPAILGFDGGEIAWKI